MQFATPLVAARLIRRYKRFFVDATLEESGIDVTAHCANTGPMTGLLEAGSRIWLEPNDDPKRKLKFGWRVLELADGTRVGVDTAVPNRLVNEAISAQQIPELAGYASLRREAPYGEKSRIDFLLRSEGRRDAYVEVKSVTLRRDAGLAEFPDTVTERGARHMDELAAMAAAGHRAVVFFLVQRTDCTRFAPAKDVDPAYATALKSAQDAGVEVLVYGTKISPNAIDLGSRLAF